MSVDNIGHQRHWHYLRSSITQSARRTSKELSLSYINHNLKVTKLQLGLHNTVKGIIVFRRKSA